MSGSLVVLTGGSGSGKTTLARAFEAAHPGSCRVIFFDSIGVPAAEEMKSFGEGHQPGGAWQRAMTLQWVEDIVGILQLGQSVLFEGQMRIAFIREALTTFGILNARIILVDCDDETRMARLTEDRNQPELANADMRNWSRYLREEAVAAGCEILDTGRLSVGDGVERLERYFVS